MRWCRSITIHFHPFYWMIEPIERASHIMRLQTQTPERGGWLMSVNKRDSQFCLRWPFGFGLTSRRVREVTESPLQDFLTRFASISTRSKLDAALFSPHISFCRGTNARCCYSLQIQYNFRELREAEAEAHVVVTTSFALCRFFSSFHHLKLHEIFSSFSFRFQSTSRGDEFFDLFLCCIRSCEDAFPFNSPTWKNSRNWK